MAQEAKIKCLIFDLDGTLWQGVLSEGGGRDLRPGMEAFIRELDRRGILMSIASKNEEAPAMAALRRFGLDEYFLCPQIGWHPKSRSVQDIVGTLGIKAGSVALLDDSAFERDEVSFALPDVRVYAPDDVASLLTRPEFTPTFITEDAARRRQMYRADMRRTAAEDAFDGSAEAFLASLGMRLTIAPVTEDNLRRVEELTIRTHQLNATGYTYDYAELQALIHSPDHVFLIASLTDTYGDSGKVGLLLMEKKPERYVLKLLIVSCRVMTRGIGTALLIHAVRLAGEAGVTLEAEFCETEHNRIMYITYKLMGFEETEPEAAAEDGHFLLRYEGEAMPAFPPYLEVIA